MSEQKRFVDRLDARPARLALRPAANRHAMAALSGSPGRGRDASRPMSRVATRGQRPLDAEGFLEPHRDEPAVAPILPSDRRETGLWDRLRRAEWWDLIAQQHWLGRRHQCDELVIGALRVEAGEDLAIEAAILVSAYTGPDRISIARFAPRGHPAGYRIYSKLAPGPWFNSVSLRRCAWPWRSPCLRWLGTMVADVTVTLGTFNVDATQLG